MGEFFYPHTFTSTCTVYVTNTGEYYNVIGTLKSCLEINATHCVCIKKPPHPPTPPTPVAFIRNAMRWELTQRKAIYATQTLSLCTGIYIESFSCVYAYAYAYASLVSFKLNQDVRTHTMGCIFYPKEIHVKVLIKSKDKYCVQVVPSYCGEQ